LINRRAIRWIDDLRSTDWKQASGVCLGTYVLGCFTAGYYLVRLRLGDDIREIGSGSVGARNVSRVLGKTGFVLTFLADFGKGAAAVWAVRRMTSDNRVLGLAMVSVVAGHLWPAQLRFQGGKGMATSQGALLVYDPKLSLAFVAVFLCAFLPLRRATLPSLISMACLPVASFFLEPRTTKSLLILSLAGLVLIGHRGNLAEEFSRCTDRRRIQRNTAE
jgi:acyl phosphate:glycerol-3-phosphate acyltransferase